MAGFDTVMTRDTDDDTDGDGSGFSRKRTYATVLKLRKAPQTAFF